MKKKTTRKYPEYDCCKCDAHIVGSWSYREHLIKQHDFSLPKAKQQRSKQKASKIVKKAAARKSKKVPAAGQIAA